MTKFIFGILLALVCPASAQEGSVSWTSSPPIGDASIDTAKMAPDSVTGASILNGTIQAVDIAPLTIDSTKLAALSVDSEKIAKGAVNTEKIQQDALLNIAQPAAVKRLGVNVIPNYTLADIKYVSAVPPTTGNLNTNAPCGGVVFHDETTNNAALCFGSYPTSPYANWIQGKYSNAMATSYPLTLQPSGGNVGIGLAIPLAKLHVDGDLAALRITGVADTVKLTVDPNGAVTVGSTATFVTGIGGQAATGGLGVVGTVTMLSSATVNGDLSATGATGASGNIIANKGCSNCTGGYIQAFDTLKFNATTALSRAYETGVVTLQTNVGNINLAPATVNTLVVNTTGIVVGNGTDTGKIQVGSATKAACLMLGDSDNAGCTECVALNGVLSCGIDADCVCDGTP